MHEPDYHLLFELVPGANLLLDSSLRVVAVSDACLDAMQMQRDQLMGHDVLAATDARREEFQARGLLPSRDVLERVFKNDGGSFADDLELAGSPNGETARSYRPTVRPLRDRTGRASFVLLHAKEVTEAAALKRLQGAQDAQLRELLLKSEHYVQLLDSAPDATVIVGEDCLIKMVNKQTESMFGYRRDELQGRPLDILIPERFRAMHALHMQRYFEHPSARPMGASTQLVGRHRDGRELPIEVSLSPQRGQHGMMVSAAIRDVTERRRLEEAARTMSDRLASAVESIQDAFALFDAEERLVLCNSVYLGLLHDTLPGQLIGKTLDELVSAWSREIAFSSESERIRFLEARRASRKSDASASFDVHLRDGRTLRVTDRRTADGGLVKTIWDLTDEESRAAELRHARASAEAASAAKSEFLASMSHELRTPLNAILGFAQLLVRDKKEPLSARHVERAGYILQSGEHLLRLIDDVLDLARIEAGRVSISIEAVNAREVLDEVHRTLAPLAERYGVQLALCVADEELPLLLIDRTRYAQILLNFGTNAAKYNRAGGRVTFSVEQTAPDRLRVTVSDTGLGIPSDKQDKLFQPFQRAGQETGPIEGTGIGLVITKRLAEMMGGSVGFHSVEGEGSTFWVDMPTQVAPLPLSTPAESAAASARRRDVQTGRRLVLYVEDNPANVHFMRDLMSSFDDIELVSVPTAELGVAFARARRPAAIVMDINLPGMSGLEALRELRAMPETADLPVIALTAAASERDRQRGGAAGFFRYLTKPVKVDELIAALELVLTV